MSESQFKQSLLLHFQCNKNFFEEKVYKQFGQQCLKENDISTLNINKMKSTIKFLFDFASNQDFKPFYNKLDININQFIKLEKQKKPPNNKGKVPMDLQNLLELILYCVNNGFDKQIPKPQKQSTKPVQKQIQQKKKSVLIQQKKKPQLIVKKQEQIKKQQKKKSLITLLNPQLQAKVDKIKLISKPIQPIKAAAKVSTRLQPEKILPKVQFKIQKYQMPNINVGPKYLQTITTPKPKKQPQPQYYYQPIDPQFAKNQQNKKLMKQRLFHLYKHYCSQQQNKGQSPSFDKIKSQMEHMTIGKFLIFCKNSSLFSDSKLITKDILTSGFRRVAEGKQQINFEQFQILLKQLDEKYMNELKKDGKQNIASYQARLRLNSNQGYKDFKKWLNMIFFTRDNRNKDNKMFQSKFDNRDLTGHSGKFQIDLQQQLNNIRYSQTIQVTNGHKGNNQIQNDKKIKPKPRGLNIQQIGMKKWPKIDWLQEQFKIQQQALQQNSIPKIARRKDVVGNLKKRVEQVSKLQMQK